MSPAADLTLSSFLYIALVLDFNRYCKPLFASFKRFFDVDSLKVVPT